MVGILIRPEEKWFKKPQLLSASVQINSSNSAEAVRKRNLSLSDSKSIWQQKLFFVSVHGCFVFF